MLHPFSFVSSPHRWWALAFFTVATVTLACILSSQGKSLRTPAAPVGILSYEFSWNRVQAEAILKSWENRKEIARQQLKWDYVFSMFYPLLLSLACGLLGNIPSNERAIIGTILSWVVLLTGPLDAIENYVLLVMIQSGASESMAKTAGWCAGLKFVLVYAALGYMAFEGIPALFKMISNMLLKS